MKFNVKTLRRAQNDYTAILSFIAERSKSGAESWAKAFDRALARLEESADSFPLAPEDEHVEIEVREILFKTRRGLFYRALFTIKGRDVFILHVRGPGQDFVADDELGPPDAG